MTKKQMEDEIRALKKEVESLKASCSENHYHYHYPVKEVSIPSQWPAQPCPNWWQNPVTYSTGTITIQSTSGGLK